MYKNSNERDIYRSENDDDIHIYRSEKEIDH